MLPDCCQVHDLRAAADAASWAAQTELSDNQAKLIEQAGRLKEGLAKRVMRQWSLRSLAPCMRAWSVYVLRRRIVRDVGGEPQSGDEEGEGGGGGGVGGRGGPGRA